MYFIAVTAELAKRFPQLIQEEDTDQLVDEFDGYLVTPSSHLPDSSNGVDVFWGTMAEIKNPVTDSYQYKTLSKLAKACCILPTSNADTERMFSILKKIQTDQRSELFNFFNFFIFNFMFMYNLQ